MKQDHRPGEMDFKALSGIPDSLRAQLPYSLDFLDDLLNSEQTYKQNLDLLMEVYIKPLYKLSETSKDMASSKELDGWFPEITSMVILSAEFIKGLQSITAPAADLGAVLDERFVGVLNYQFKFFTIFGAYGNRFSHTICTLKRRIDDLPKMKKFITVWLSSFDLFVRGQKSDANLTVHIAERTIRESQPVVV